MDAFYDVVIIGSGFGGSVSALRLTEKGYRVGVLEAGRRYRTGDFAETNWDVKRFIWGPRFGLYGIQRLDLLSNVLVLSGAGVGGGSLVYANTLYEPHQAFFTDPQWRAITDWKRELAPFYALAKRMLGVTEANADTPADDVMRQVADRLGVADTFQPTPVGVFLGEAGVEVDDPYFGGVGPRRAGCTSVGACMIGCNQNAKNTLDKNYLYLAEKRGVEVIPETHVELVEELEGGGYRLRWRRSRWPMTRRGSMTARKVIFAAGVLGTVKLLLQCKEKGSLPRISDQLGNVVRTNSEALLGITSKSRNDLWEGVAIAAKVEVDDVTHLEAVRFSKGSDVMLLLGTILADGGPGVLRPLRWLGNIIRHPLDFLRVSKPWGKAEHSVVLMAMQTADNHTRLVQARQWLWPFSRALTSQPIPGQPGIPSYVPIANEVAREISVDLDAIPQNSVNEVFLGTGSTAHILGGCAIGSGPDTGVIDPNGEVYGHEGLYVIDGSVIGANLGVNPSLTITALAEHLCSRFPRAG